MGRCVGYIGWRAPQVQRPAGEHPMESMDPTEPTGEVVFPKLVAKRQLFVHVGERTESDPALLPCGGSCGSKHIKWTWHYRVSGVSYQCESCKATRKWGIGFFGQ